MERAIRIVQVEHVEMRTKVPFAEVMRRIEAETRSFDAIEVRSLVEAKASPDSVVEAIEAMAGRSGFMRFWPSTTARSCAGKGSAPKQCGCSLAIR